MVSVRSSGTAIAVAAFTVGAISIAAAKTYVVPHMLDTSGDVRRSTSPTR